MEKKEYKSVQISSGDIVITAKQAEILKQTYEIANMVTKAVPAPNRIDDDILAKAKESRMRRIELENYELRRKNDNLIAIIWVMSTVLIALSIWLLLRQ
jgi:hypothetical protein